MPPARSGATISNGPSRVPDARGTGMAYSSSLVRGASPLGLPDTLSRAPLRRRAPFAWLASLRSLAVLFRAFWVSESDPRLPFVRYLLVYGPCRRYSPRSVRDPVAARERRDGR